MRNEAVSAERAFLGAIGICAKARKLIMGVPMICEAMKAGKRIFLVLEPCDNASNSSKRLHDRCAYYNVPMHTLALDGEALAAAVGKKARLGAVAVTDEHLYRLVLSSLGKTTEN